MESNSEITKRLIDGRELTLDPATHQYHIEGLRYDSVSNVLNFFSLPTFPQHVALELARSKRVSYATAQNLANAQREVSFERGRNWHHEFEIWLRSGCPDRPTPDTSEDIFKSEILHASPFYEIRKRYSKLVSEAIIPARYPATHLIEQPVASLDTNDGTNYLIAGTLDFATIWTSGHKAGFQVYELKTGRFDGTNAHGGQPMIFLAGALGLRCTPYDRYRLQLSIYSYLLGQQLDKNEFINRALTLRFQPAAEGKIIHINDDNQFSIYSVPLIPAHEVQLLLHEYTQIKRSVSPPPSPDSITP